MCFLYCRDLKHCIVICEELWGLGKNSEAETEMIFKTAIKISRIVGGSLHEMKPSFARVNFIPRYLIEKSVRKS